MAPRKVRKFPGFYREELKTGEKRFRIVIRRHDLITQKYFYFTSRNSEIDALKRAKLIWSDLRKMMPVITRQINAQIERRKSPSGFIGVRRVTSPRKGHDYDDWKAVFTDIRGQRRTKSFSVNLYGEQEAKKLAIQARLDGLSQLDSLLDFPCRNRFT